MQGLIALCNPTFQFAIEGFFNSPLRIFSKITPSLFTIKEGSTSHPAPLSLGERGKPLLLVAQNRSKVVGGIKAPRLSYFTQQCCDYLCGVNRLDESLMLCLDESLMQCASPAGRRCNTAQKSPIRRKTIATLLRRKSSPARRAKAPLAIPKLWRSYSVASYIPRPYGRGVGLGYWGKDPLFVRGGQGCRKILNGN